MDYLFILIAILVTAGAQVYISSSYSKYKKITAKKNISGFEVARAILDKHGLEKVYITEISGTMTDLYDSSRKVVKLSNEVFHGNSIASLAVAAHECGHAIQDKENYGFLRIRERLIPLVSFSSVGGYIAILVGIFFSLTKLLWIRIGLEIVILIFQLVTLPVEFDASERAKKELIDNGFINNKELEGCSNMLKAAAFTYVASLISGILEIGRFIYIFGGNDRD